MRRGVFQHTTDCRDRRSEWVDRTFPFGRASAAPSGATAERQPIDSSVSDGKTFFAVSNYVHREDAPPLGATLLDLGVGDTIGLA